MDKSYTSKKKKGNPRNKDSSVIKDAKGVRFIEILSPNKIPKDMRPPGYEEKRWEDDFDINGLDYLETLEEDI